MSQQFPSLPNPANLGAVFSKFPNGVSPLLELHDVVLRAESPFTIGERELIAAHVSGLNSCQYCHGAHTYIAKDFGIDPALIESMQKDLDSSQVSSKLKPILAYVSKLTLSPSKMTSRDAEAVYEAGWEERALYDAILVCSLFNFMNRLVEGTGCTPNHHTQGKASTKPLESYLAWGKDQGLANST